MIFQRLSLMIAAIAATFATLNGGTVLLDPAETASNWKIFPGPEFPGATGEILPDSENGKLLFRVGFSGESKYVAAVYTPVLPEDVEIFYFRVVPDMDGDLFHIGGACRTAHPCHREIFLYDIICHNSKSFCHVR